MREEKRWNLVTGPPRFVAVLFEPPIRNFESAGLLAGGKIGGKSVKKRKKGKKKGKFLRWHTAASAKPGFSSKNHLVSRAERLCPFFHSKIVRLPGRAFFFRWRIFL
jgi:hypothetical protein